MTKEERDFSYVNYKELPQRVEYSPEVSQMLYDRNKHIEALQSNIEMLKYDMEAIRDRGLEYKKLYEELKQQLDGSI